MNNIKCCSCLKYTKDKTYYKNICDMVGKYVINDILQIIAQYINMNIESLYSLHSCDYFTFDGGASFNKHYMCKKCLEKQKNICIMQDTNAFVCHYKGCKRTIFIDINKNYI